MREMRRWSVRPARGRRSLQLRWGYLPHRQQRWHHLREGWHLLWGTWLPNLWTEVRLRALYLLKRCRSAPLTKLFLLVRTLASSPSRRSRWPSRTRQSQPHKRPHIGHDRCRIVGHGHESSPLQAWSRVSWRPPATSQSPRGGPHAGGSPL